MLFNSWGYLLFLLIAVPVHWLLPHRFRVVFICGASLLFYGMWRWEFCFLILLSAIVDFACARRIHLTKNRFTRKVWLTTSLSVNLGLLAYFKYTYFFVDNLGIAAELLGADQFSGSTIGLSIILPLGISFYTFQTISYTIDVYRKQIGPSDSFPTFFAYVIFWPQLIAGPILRANEVMPQLRSHRYLDMNFMSKGMGLVIIGLFKKTVLADNIAPYVDFWFGLDPGILTALDVWNATFLFGLQIYFDFSGYSDIAIGSALLLGLKFPDNFNWPYMATSPKDFWERWHISLSSWIRDYLYLPLTGQKFRGKSTGGISVAVEQSGKDKRTKALLLTWAIMGLWHGAAWTFILWGLFHSAIILLYRFFGPLRRLASKQPIAGWMIMLPIAMSGWIFFRAASVDQALIMYGTLLNPFEYEISPMIAGLSNPTAGWSYLWNALIMSGMVGLYVIQNSADRMSIPSWFSVSMRTSYLTVMVFTIVLFMQQNQQFIYFQF